MLTGRIRGAQAHASTEVRARGGGKRKPALAVLLLLAISLATTGCLVPPGHPVKIPSGLADGPDPAANPVWWGLDEVYTTQSGFFNIPSYWFNIFNNQTGNLHDALPHPPSWVSGQIWAPTVRFVDGRYLMLFSAQPTDRWEHCLGAATSSDGQVFQPVEWYKTCYPGSGIGYFDPYLFYAPNGDLWMLYSQEAPIGGPFGSQIRTQLLNPDGLSGVPRVNYELTGFADVAGAAGNTGTHALVENPAMVADPDNGFDLLVSVGTWDQLGAYSTVEVGCSEPWGGCATSYARAIMTSGSTYGWNPGGASLDGDEDPASGQHLFFHSGPPGARADYAGTVSRYP